jgi:hypothetical protein
VAAAVAGAAGACPGASVTHVLLVHILYRDVRCAFLLRHACASPPHVWLQGTVLKVLLLSVEQHGWRRDALSADEAAAALQDDGFDPR